MNLVLNSSRNCSFTTLPDVVLSDNFMRSYRYGFNGMENDSEVSGEGNSYDFGARMYNSRVGRFMSVDPKANKYPYMTPYCVSANNPIMLVDENGEGPVHPGKGRRLYTNFIVVADWELLEFEATPLKNSAHWDMSLNLAAKWAGSEYEDNTSWGDTRPDYPPRDFNGAIYTTKIRKGGALLKTNNLLDEARLGKRKTYMHGNFLNLERAAKSGNYVFGEESGSDYTVTTVVNNWVTEEAVFEEGDNNTWKMKSKTHYEVSGGRIEEVNQTKTIDRWGNKQTNKVKYQVFDVKTTTTTYDDSGKETTTVKNSTISFKQ